MKKRVTIRLKNAEMEFLENIRKKYGFDYSTTIRFCINFVILFRGTEEFKKLLRRMPKDLK